jgi:tetratricopeptide (TPR) repeat protein
VQFLYLVHDRNEFRTAHGHARFLPRSKFNLGAPADWIKILTEEGLITKPYRHSTAEILGASSSDHSLSPDDRFNEEQLLAAISGNPEHWRFPLELARYYRRRNRHDDAEAMALASLALRPDEPEAVFELLLNRWNGRKISADEAAGSFIPLAKKHQIDGLLYELSRALLHAGRFEEALEWSLKAIVAQPVRANAYHIRAAAFEKLKNFEAAERAISAAIALSTKNQTYYHVRARLLDRLGRVEEAISANQQSIDHGGKFPALWHMSNLLMRVGRDHEALAAAQNALSVAGDHASIVQNQIDTLIARTADLESSSIAAQ